MTKLLAIIEFKNPLSPSEGAHPQYIAQSFFNQKLGKNNPVSIRVLNTPKVIIEEAERYYD